MNDHYHTSINRKITELPLLLSEYGINSPVTFLMIMPISPSSRIRALVTKALSIRQLTPDIENAINFELTRLGYLPEGDMEVLELLMEEMDAGRVRLVPTM